MLTPSISFAVVGLLGFALSRLALGFSKVFAEHPESYKWYRDTSVFLALLLFGGMSAIFYNAPDMYDVAAPVAWYWRLQFCLRVCFRATALFLKGLFRCGRIEFWRRLLFLFLSAEPNILIC